MNFERDTRKLAKMLRKDGFWIVKGGTTQSHTKWTDGKHTVNIARTPNRRNQETRHDKEHLQAGGVDVVHPTTTGNSITRRHGMYYSYEGIIKKYDDGMCTVAFPDWGTVTEGDDFNAAIRMGTDLLESDITYALATGNELPSATFGHSLASDEERLVVALSSNTTAAKQIWPWVSTSEAAAMLGVSSARVRRLVLDGLLESMKDGRDVFVSRADVEARAAASPRAGRPAAKREAVAA